MIVLTPSLKMMVLSQRCAHLHFMCMHLLRAAWYRNASSFVVHVTYYNGLLVTMIISSSIHTSEHRFGVHSSVCLYQLQENANFSASADSTNTDSITKCSRED